MDIYKRFGILFILTGLFAIIGGLYTWGKGNIFHQSELIEVLIPWADIILSGPLSIVGGIGLWYHKSWAVWLGATISGIYIFGSTLVFITIFWDMNLSFFLLVPALCGLLIGVFFIFLVMTRATFRLNANRKI